MQIERFDLAGFEQASGPERSDRAAALDRICRDTGFILLDNHGVTDDQINSIWDLMTSFFDLSVEQKRQVAPAKGQPYGYLAVATEALAASRGDITPPDLKESFNGGPASVPAGLDDPVAQQFCFAPTPWPEITGFREIWSAYYQQMERLADRVMAALAAALGLPDNFFATFINEPISALRALNYPATGDAAESGQQRAGAHSDYGSLTILLPQPDRRGLQIQDRDGAWVDVIAPKSCFVVNIGDLMARWTADRWVSTLHRVVALPNQPRRQSLAFFHQPNWDAEIVPLDGSDAYPPVLSGPYLMSKFQATGRVDETADANDVTA